MTSRVRVPALASAFLALTLSACGTDVRSQTAEQAGGVGDVVITTKICQSDIPMGCRAPSSVSAGKQLLVAFRVPAGVEAPESLTARVPVGYSGVTVRLRRDDAYGAWVDQQPSAIDGDTRSFGYVSDVLPGVATDDITVTAKLAAGLTEIFEYQTLVGYRTGSHGAGPSRPVDCTGELEPVSETSEERITDCASGGTSAGGDTALALRGLEVAGERAAVRADPGDTVSVPFKLKLSGPALDRTVAVSAATTLPGATVKVEGGDLPFVARERSREVTVAVPADAEAGDYEVTLSARIGGTTRTATRTLTVTGNGRRAAPPKAEAAAGSGGPQLPVVPVPSAPAPARATALFMNAAAEVPFGFVCTEKCGQARAALLVRFGTFGARAARNAPLRMLEIGETTFRAPAGRRVRGTVSLHPKARRAVGRGRVLRGLLVVRAGRGKPVVRRVMLQRGR